MPIRREPWFSQIGRKLREDGKAAAQEPLPQRWVDLIHYLDEQERGREEREAAAQRKDQRRH
jgi:hypothetical protein